MLSPTGRARGGESDAWARGGKAGCHRGAQGPLPIQGREAAIDPTPKPLSHHRGPESLSSVTADPAPSPHPGS